MVCVKDKNTPALVEPLLAVDPAGQPVEHAIELRAVIGALVIQNHQVDQKTPRAQVAVHFQRLAHQVQLTGIVNFDQQNGVISRDAKTPQPWLTQPVFEQRLCRRARQRSGIDQAR